MTELLLLVAMALAISAWFVARGARRQIAILNRRCDIYDRRLLDFMEELRRVRSPLPGMGPTDVAPTEAALPAADDFLSPAEEVPDLEPVMAQSPPIEATPVTPARRPANWEGRLTENWLVWLGGAALALGGAFLVKVSIERGLLVPIVRVILGLCLGIAISGTAERSRRGIRPGHYDLTYYVPQVLAGAGAAIIFASLYAAYAFYDLLPGPIAFTLLAMTAGATIAQSLRYGPAVAAIGLIGGYVVPMLVGSTDPQAVPLFAYLTVLTAAALALLRHRGWWWLAWLSLAGAVGWAFLWLGAADKPETAVVGFYLLLLLGLFVAFRYGVPRVGFLRGTIDAPMVPIVSRTAFWIIAAAIVLLAHVDGFASGSIGTAVVATVALMAIAFHDSRLDDTVATAGALALVLLAGWALPLPVPEMNLWVFRVATDHVADFSTAAVGFAALLGVGGFIATRLVPRPGRWAAVSAAAPLLIMLIAYWRLQQFDLHIAWGIAALVLAGIELAAASAIASRRDGAMETEIALAAYAVAVLGSTISAAALSFSNAWLTVVFALHLPAMGWIEGRIRVGALRWLAAAVAAAVLVRLMLNPYVLDYQLGPTPIFNWLLYGYGVPAVAFIVATRQFGSRADNLLVGLLELGSVLFSFLLLTLELLHVLHGRLTMSLDDCRDLAVPALWLAFGTGVLILGQRRHRPVLRWTGGGLLVLATATDFVLQIATVFDDASVGRTPVLNALLAADVVPAFAYAAVALRGTTQPVLCRAARIVATGFAFIWVTLETRHLFRGPHLFNGAASEAEWYAYSVAWLLFAGAGLAVGLARHNEWLRRAGLVGIALVAAKVFLSDTAELSGLLRALSFLGIGGALVGIGYAYRRLRPIEPAAL